MSIGKLYDSNDEQFLVSVNYQLYDKSPNNFWGELTLDEYRTIDSGRGYTIELEDKRKYQCYLQKRVNRAVSGVPPRYIYRFNSNTLT